MARLPQPGGDDGAWGAILNDYLAVAHDTDGSLKAGSVVEGQLSSGVQSKLNATPTVADGSITEAKLDAAAQAKLNATGSGGVTSVNTRSGAVTLTSVDVGLGNVDNTSDANKPVSSATVTALAGKQAASTDLSAISGLTPANDDVIQRKAGAWTNRTPAQLKLDLAVSKTDVGLGNVDNTSDVNKPVSTATQAALNLKADASTVGAKVLLIANAAALPAGTPAGVIVVVQS